MAQYNFEGDIDNINEHQLAFINKVIQEQDLKVTKVVFSSVGQAGDNFVANVKRISIEGENGSLKMIVKIAPAFEMARKMMNTESMFQNEHTMYTEVLPTLVQLQKAAGVPEEEQLRYAKCYGSHIEAPNEVVILEDLSELDFVMLNKFDSLSDDCVKSVLKNFAILHSLSYVLKKKQPEKFELLKNKLIDVWSLAAADPEAMAQMQVMEDNILTVFDNEAHKSIVRNKIANMFKLGAKLSKTADNKYSVIQQGDAWTNNIMFKFVGDELVQSIMIDYQVSRNNSPVVDLLYMIFNCTDHETRSKNYYNWIDYYHTELDNSLSNFGMKANFVYPKDQLDADLKRYGKLLFGLSILLANMLTRDSAEASKFMEAIKGDDVGVIMDTMKIEDTPETTASRLQDLTYRVRLKIELSKTIMAQYNFEGDFDNINERQLEFINKVIQEQDLKVTKVVFSPVGQAGDNFVANVKRISVEGENGNLKLIVKVSSGIEIVRKTTNTESLFNNEITMYAEVLPKLVELQKAAGVPEEEQLRYAKFYGSLNEAPNEIIILEDLAESGYIMLSKFESLSNESVKSILKNFAVLHSLSYALKKKEPETYELFYGKLIDTWTLMAQMPDFAFHLEHLETEILTILEDEEHKRKVRNKVLGIFGLASKLSKDQNRYSIIQQGDAWTNNVMFKFEGNSVQSIMIDYQASKSSSPAMDLLYMIFNCTDHETRSKNYYDWLDYYHSELDNSLSNFGLKANFVYPKDQLDADMKRYGKLHFGMCILLSNMLMRDSKEAGEIMGNLRDVGLDEAMQAMKIESLQNESMNRLKKRIVGLIDSFTEFGLL
ncbi:hypothetical protein PYW08_006181 [Mythimna loreyi]|uniref:Uncharacterized protein n=1 Tax=Mythimna loreyi TaxID=667449 RepID=A0ACC2QM88_9NEOP|nr:hypothetical protein PYW08_006181 [Mythimna loreyi]